MFRPILAVVLLSFSFSAQAKQICTFGSTFLKAGKGNACLQNVANNVKNPKDRARFQKIIKRWNPSKGVFVQRVPGGYQMFRGGKLISQAAWILKSPPTIYWNGKVMTIAKPLGSVGETIDALFATKKTAWNFSILPQAEAATGDEAMSEDFFSMFSFFYAHRTVEETAADLAKDSVRRFFPEPENFVQDWITGRTFTCGEFGVTDLKYKYQYRYDKPVREVSLTPLASDEFIVSGALNGGRKIRVKYVPEMGFPMCGDFGGDTDHAEICDAEWKKLMDSDIRYGSLLVSQGIQVLDCRAFEGALGQKCVDHFKAFHSRFKYYGKPSYISDSRTGQPAGMDHMVIELCENDDCSKTAAMPGEKGLAELMLTPEEIAAERKGIIEAGQRRADEYIDVLRNEGVQDPEKYCNGTVCLRPDGMAAFDRPKKNRIEEALGRTGRIGEPDFWHEQYNLWNRLGESVAGATMLGAACKTEAGRKAVEQLDIRLTPYNPEAVK